MYTLFKMLIFIKKVFRLFKRMDSRIRLLLLMEKLKKYNCQLKMLILLYLNGWDISYYINPC
jgi:hypothetical protein